MDDAARVGCADRAGGLTHEQDRAVERHRSALEPGLEVIAAQAFHQQIHAVAVIADVVDLHDAGWCTLAAARASLKNRVTMSRRADISGLSTLTTAAAPESTWVAKNTSPKPPLSDDNAPSIR